MVSQSEAPVARNYFLKPGYIFLAAKSTVISTVVGSSVAVCLYDRKRKIGAMNHFRYPFVSDQNQATARFGNVATIALIKMMCEDGSNRKHLEAQIFGGAHNEKSDNDDVGRKNYLTAKKILSREGIPIVSEDVGGMKGRKIVFSTSNNEIAVMKVEKLRNSDWYPYDGER